MYDPPKSIEDVVEVVPYNADWPRIFSTEAERLRSALSKETWQTIHHIGSTSIIGMPSKPIVDILVVVRSVKDVSRSAKMEVSEVGYEYLPRESKIYRLMFAKRDAMGARVVHLHLGHYGSKLWDTVVFRDYLEKHEILRSEYVELKKELVAKYRHNRQAYQNGKTEFFHRVVKLAKS